MGSYFLMFKQNTESENLKAAETNKRKPMQLSISVKHV